jgi:hypothetical protein
MKTEVNLIISIVLMALGIDYVIEGYNAAFFGFELLALTVNVLNNKFNYKNVGYNTFIIFVLINIFTIRVGLNSVFKFFILNNLFISINTAIWFEIFKKKHLYNNIRIEKIIFVCNLIFMFFVLLTILFGGKYFLYPYNLPVNSEVIMIVIFSLMFEPIVIVNRILKFKSELTLEDNKIISVQNVLK